MAKQLYETFIREQVTDAMLDDAARLFSENYGTWGECSGRPGEAISPYSSSFFDY